MNDDTPMSIRRSETVGPIAAAAFSDAPTAESAVQALLDGGFDREQIGVVLSQNSDQFQNEWIPAAEEETAEQGANYVAAGGFIGGLLGGGLALAVPGVGWAAAIGFAAAGVAAGAFGGGLWGPLIELGLSEERAEYLDERLGAGDIIVTVNDERADDAQDILESLGGSTAPD